MKTNNDEYRDFKELIAESKKDISDYVEKRFTLTKLKTYEKIANFSSRLMYGLVIFMLVFNLSILLIMISGLYMGQLLNSYPQGFGIVFLVFALITALVALNKRSLKRFFVNKTLRTIKKIESDEE